MTEARFIAKNETAWKRLQDFNLRGGIGKLSHSEIREFARLFRLASFHLAYAKTHFPTGSALPYLNQVVGVAHNYFYIRESSGFFAIRRYFTQVFPQAVCASWRYIAIATAVFLLGLFFASIYVAQDTTRLATFMPAQFNTEYLGENLGEMDGWDHSYMSAAIMTNNIAVAINSFVLGIFGGLGTIYILIYNGMIVGGLFGFLHTTGADMLLSYALVLPHGIIELAAIFICGAGGLMIGHGVLMPGRFSRKDAIVFRAKQAAVLIPGIVAMLIIAGLIEGFFTPLPIDSVHKLLFAGLTAAGLAVYFGI